MENVHLSIRALRLRLNLTQKYVSEQLGISEKTYRALEAGKSPITPKRIMAISRIFELPINEIAFFDHNQGREATSPKIQNGNDAPTRLELDELLLRIKELEKRIDAT